MRKLMFVLALAVSVQGFVSAQDWRGFGQPVTVTGTFGLQHGRITVSSDGAVYYVPVLERYIGFIEGLKEGAEASLEGYVLGTGSYVHIRPVKVTIDGKNYDFSPMVSPEMGYGGRGRGYGGHSRDSYGHHGRGGRWW
jgi:hypothetical protein